MKKCIIFAALLIILFSFSSCNLEIPSAIEIKGSPELRLSANLNMGELLQETVDELLASADYEGMPGFSLISCTSTDIVTYIIKAELFNESFDAYDLLPDNIKLVLDSLPEFIPSELISLDTMVLIPEISIDIPGMDFSSILDGFSFTNAKAMLYITGSPIIDFLTVKLKIDDRSPHEYKGRFPSDLTGPTYGGTQLPQGIEIPLSFDGSETKICFSAYIDPNINDKIQKDLLQNANIQIEIAIWLPLELVAVKPLGAKFSFKTGDFFEADQDLFGRESISSPNLVGELIESLKLEIKFNKSPFSNASLIVENYPENHAGGSGDAILIICPLTTSFNFEVNESDMKKINESWPFSPEFSIEFKKGGSIYLPRDFKVTEFSFKARLNYRYEFGGTTGEN